jgi:hypothetical protein
VTRRTVGLAIVIASLALGVVVLFAERFGALFFAAGIALVAGLLVAYVPADLGSPVAIVHAVGPRRRQALFLACIAVGLAVRIALLGEYGTEDPGTDLAGGGHVLSAGLSQGFHGHYFPLSYQEFASVIALARELALREIVVFKSVNLLCDLLCFGVIAILLRRWGRNPGWALLYWLMPYVAALDWLGYVDFQMGLFALLTLVPVAFGASKADWLVAGIPLAVAVLLKPQALALPAIVVLYLLARIAIERRAAASSLRPALLLVAPACAGAVYSAYFASRGHALTFLVRTYTHATSFQPWLSGDMPNIWYVVAYHYRRRGQDLAGVSQPAVFHSVSRVLTAAVLAALAWVVARTADRRPDSLNLLLLVGGATLTVPMTMTEAHENHMFLGAMFGAVVIAVSRNRTLAVAAGSLLMLDFLNVIARYGFGNPNFGPRPLGLYTDPVAVGVAGVCSLLYVAVAFSWASLTRYRVSLSTP